jgi:hypothetical protein
MLQPPRDFGADDHFIRRDDSSQNDFAPARNDGKINNRPDGGGDQQNEKESALHGQADGSLAISPPRRKPFRLVERYDFAAADCAAKHQHSSSKRSLVKKG